MTPTPEQIVKWREEFELWCRWRKAELRIKADGSYYFDVPEFQWVAYLRACTEQNKEIEVLKATITDLTPLAKFGAEVAHHVDGLGAISTKVVWSIAERFGVLTDDGSEYTSNVGPTIETLLDDQYTAPTKTQQGMLGPITAADITSEMYAEWNKVFGSDMSSPCPNDSAVMAAAICAYLKFANL
jgi:hypothetical protein